jgi:CRISPR-associated protein Csx10
MKAIVVTLETLQPVLATSFQGDPNSDISYPYIPGSAIRGAIISRYMQQYQLSDLELTNSEIRRLFFEDRSTQYLNAYIVGEKELYPFLVLYLRIKNTNYLKIVQQISMILVALFLKI